MTTDRLALNGALVKLTNEWNESAAKLVVKFGSKLPKAKPIAHTRVDRHQNKGTITGYTKEQGDVTIQTSQPEEIREMSWGIKKERIGWFRLWKVREGILQFHHFWASDITTESENPENKPPKYRLEYNPKNLIPYSLSVWAEKDVLRLGVVAIFCSYLVPIYGKPKLFPKGGYGLSIGY